METAHSTDLSQHLLPHSGSMRLGFRPGLRILWQVTPPPLPSTPLQPKEALGGQLLQRIEVGRRETESKGVLSDTAYYIHWKMLQELLHLIPFPTICVHKNIPTFPKW